MKIVYLATAGPDLADRVEALKNAGHKVSLAHSTKEAERLLEQKDGPEELVYEWVFAYDLKWIKRRFTTIGVNPNVSFVDFVKELDQIT